MPNILLQLTYLIINHFKMTLGTSGSGNDTLGDMEVPVGRNGVCNEKTERFHSIIGDIILITAQVILFRIFDFTKAIFCKEGSFFHN